MRIMPEAANSKCFGARPKEDVVKSNLNKENR